MAPAGEPGRRIAADALHFTRTTDVSSPGIGMFDTVRVVEAPETVAADLAGRIGVVYGESMPASSGVGPVIGTLHGEWALNVHFEDREGEFWFAPELLEFVDHGAGTVIGLAVSPVEYVRRADGGWDERPRGGSGRLPLWMRLRAWLGRRRS